MSFDNKVVMITGAAGNLGRAVAAAFASAGASLVLVDLDEGGLRAAYPGADARRLLLAADLTRLESVQTAVQAAVDRFGRIDALCNIAGGFRMGPAVHETLPELWAQMMDMNAGTLLNAVRAVVPRMLAAGGGCIVNVGAGAGQGGRAHMGAYSAAKSAVIRLTEAMAGELRERGINVNCVLPSIIDTPQNRADMPQADPRRWVAPQDLAQVILFLCSDGARAVHGAAVPVVGLS
ncbi:MAG: SDR family NAD(P)-dependent oxidoreductase [Gammaproteobacteria bacterium]|nr:SDR family NAD(P)-dependent oxidoreductase [Gammaproteobacteria bacterium]